MDSRSDATVPEAVVVSSQLPLHPSAQLQTDEPFRRDNDSASSRHLNTSFHYSIWGSEPRYSQLSEVKLDVDPPCRKTASPCPSFTNNCGTNFTFPCL